MDFRRLLGGAARENREHSGGHRFALVSREAAEDGSGVFGSELADAPILESNLDRRACCPHDWNETHGTRRDTLKAEERSLDELVDEVECIGIESHAPRGLPVDVPSAHPLAYSIVMGSFRLPGGALPQRVHDS